MIGKEFKKLLKDGKRRMKRLGFNPDAYERGFMLSLKRIAKYLEGIERTSSGG